VRILDLGCGPAGTGLETVWGVSESDEVTGVDIDEGALAVARQRFPHRTYLAGRGEAVPCPDASFDRVISSVAFCYMNVPKALSEIRRVLAPGGRISLSLLPLEFTLVMWREAFPRLVSTTFQTYALANGIWFYCTGKTVPFVNGKTEAFHTERGMRIALRREGFIDPRFYWRPGKKSKMLVVEARKESLSAVA
jgi:ubiquinone/menaquinone biosynthesis C-methylase UbiE